MDIREGHLNLASETDALMFTMRQAVEAEEDPGQDQHEDGLSGVLHRVVEEVRRAISRDVSGAEMLHTLLSAPWLHALLKVYECLLQFQTLLPSPALPYASSLSYEVLMNLSDVPSPSAEARELFSILSSPDMQALLSAHDTVAQSDYEPVLPPLPDDLPQEEEAMRIVCLVKNKQPLGATIKKDEETGEIFIARVIHGGLADRSGLLHPGDLLVEVNGSPVEGLEPEQVIEILIQSEGTILFKVIPNTPQTTNSQMMLRVRAMADYSPLQDPSIPCPDAGMAFRKGDLLEIVDQTDIHWWQARKLPSTTSCAGLIPSTSLLKSKQREQWWCQPFQAHTCTKPCVKMPGDGTEEDTKDADDKCIKADEEDFDSEDLREEEVEAEPETSVDGIYAAGFRRSFRMWRRTAFRKRRQSCYSCSPNSRILSNPYEEVMTYQRSPQDLHRLIVLVGASGVGVNEMRKRLITLNPTTFQGPVPHTTRPPKEGEACGREYHFITKELFEDMISKNKFLEHGEYKGHLYGTTSDMVKDVLSSGKMCLVDIEPHNIHSLRRRDLKPYVIFVKPPSVERLKLTRREAHVPTSYNANRPFTDEDFAELEVTTKMIETKYCQYFDSVVVNDELQDSCMQLFTTILQAQDEAQWVPTAWASPEEP